MMGGWFHDFQLACSQSEKILKGSTNKSSSSINDNDTDSSSGPRPVVSSTDPVHFQQQQQQHKGRAESVYSFRQHEEQLIESADSQVTDCLPVLPTLPY